MGAYVTAENIVRKTAEWREEIAAYNRRDLRPDAERSALLVIDMQNHFGDPDGAAFMEAVPAVLPNIGRLVGVYRERGLPVIFTAHVHEDERRDGGNMSLWWGDLIMKGTRDARIMRDLEPRESEKVVTKSRYSAFYNTELETNLRCLGVRDVVITGVMTNLCCESTARDAFFRDYRVFFVMDATAAVTEEFHVSTLRNLAYGFACITETTTILEELSRTRAHACSSR
jgi:isochorismate hydrolase